MSTMSTKTMMMRLNHQKLPNNLSAAVFPPISKRWTGSIAKTTANITTNDDKTASKTAMRKARKERLDSVRAKQEAFAALYGPSSTLSDASLETTTAIHPSNTTTTLKTMSTTVPNDDDEEETVRMQREQEELLTEARAITQSLYRSCLRCVKIMRPGNEHDEAEFRRREEAQLQEFDDDQNPQSSRSLSFSFAPPVDRNNELNSRANYYLEWTREGFHQESDCLPSTELWREEALDRFVNLIRTGEEKRIWVLQDYRFSDPFVAKGDARAERLDAFEERAGRFVRDGYRSRGWLLQEDVRDGDVLGEEEDEFWKEDEEMER